MTCGVYIARDASGTALYIGSAGDLDGRIAQHVDKDWWPAVAHVEQIAVGTRALAFSVERDLIKSLAPVYNRLGSGSAAKVVSRNVVGPVIKPKTDALASLIDLHGSVAKLADAVGVNHMTMSNIWRGVTLPSSKVIARLMVLSEMSFDDLFAVEVVGDPDADLHVRRPSVRRTS